MTRFGKKSFIWLAAGSIIVAGGLLARAVVGHGAEKTNQSLQQLVQSEAELERVKLQLAKWEKMKATGAIVVPRVEPVTLNADFAPSELPGINRVLAGMYADHGYLNLKSFDFAWGTGGSVHVAVTGDKIFMQ